MTDARLRRLERDAAQGAATDGGLSLARELERLGRADDAVDVLLAGCDEPAARAELVRLRPGSGGRSFDVRPLASAPRLRWRWGQDEGSVLLRGSGLTPTPFSVAVDLVDRAAPVLDLRTGQPRFTLPTARSVDARSCHAQDGVLLVVDRGRETGEVRLAGYDAWTGETAWTTSLPGDAAAASDLTCRVLQDAIVVQARPGALRRHDLPSARRPPAAGVRWQLPERAEAAVVGPWRGRLLVVLHEPDAPRRLVALDGAGGAAPIAEVEGPIDQARVDGDGLVVTRTSGPFTTLTAHDPDGAVRWERRLRGLAVLECLSPRFVALRTRAGPPRRLVVLDRARGEDVLRLEVSGGRACVARGVLMAETAQDLRGIDLDTGALLWSLPGAPPCMPVPIDRAVLFVTGGGTVECWGD